jgi:hypothetical protein
MNNTRSIRHFGARERAPIGRRSVFLVVLVLLGAATILASASAGTTACAVCGKNLIKNPGAEAGLGLTSVDASGAVPGWTTVAGEFGAASYTFPNGWFSKKSKGPKKRGRNYFFGGTVRAAIEAPATIGKQTIALPAAAAGKKATLSGWLGNYVQNRSQVRAEFADAAGTILSRIRIGPDTTISSTDMSHRSRSGTVPGGATQVTIVVTFAGGGANYKLAGADELSLMLS